MVNLRQSNFLKYDKIGMKALMGIELKDCFGWLLYYFHLVTLD